MLPEIAYDPWSASTTWPKMNHIHLSCSTMHTTQKSHLILAWHTCNIVLVQLMASNSELVLHIGGNVLKTQTWLENLNPVPSYTSVTQYFGCYSDAYSFIGKRTVIRRQLLKLDSLESISIYCVEAQTAMFLFLCEADPPAIRVGLVYIRLPFIDLYAM